jgi:hypothetical protein
MASVGDALCGERLLQTRAHLVEDVGAFFRMYLSPSHPRIGALPAEGPRPGPAAAER